MKFILKIFLSELRCVFLLFLKLENFSPKQLVLENLNSLVLLLVIFIYLYILSFKLDTLFMHHHLLVLVVEIVDAKQSIQRP